MDGPFPGPRPAAEDDAEREPSDLPGLRGWRRPVGGAPHPQDLREIVDAILKVTQPKRILLFGSGARHQMHDDSNIDILVIDEAPRGVLELKLDIGASLPDRVRWTDIVVLTPGASPSACSGRMRPSCRYSTRRPCCTSPRPRQGHDGRRPDTACGALDPRRLRLDGERRRQNRRGLRQVTLAAHRREAARRSEPVRCVSTTARRTRRGCSPGSGAAPASAATGPSPSRPRRCSPPRTGGRRRHT